MKKYYKRLFGGLIIMSVVFVSLLFFKGITKGPTLSGPEKPQSITPTVAPEATPETKAPATTPETKERLEIDHPLPPEPVTPVVNMASAHFEMAEYACDCSGYCDGFPEEMDPLLLEKVEALRCALGAPLIITSGVRCPERNAEVGGIPNSWHLSGHAADLYCPDIPHTQVAALARSLGLGVIEYPRQRFDHVEIWG